VKHPRRTAAVVALAVIASLGSSGAGSAVVPDAKKKPKGPKVRVEDACTILWPQRIEKALGAPVVLLPDATIAGAAGCAAAIGDPGAPPGGTLQAFTEYPTIISGNPNARAAVEDRRAGDALSDDILTDVEGVGRSAYFNRTKGTITVLATKKYAFTLQWARAGDVEMTDADRTKLTSLAKNVVARFTR